MDDAPGRLLEIAGDLGRYVVMRRAGPIKYSWRYRPLTRSDAAAHLNGWLTIGTELRRQDGTSCALAWDGDTAADWLALAEASRTLARAGARPLLERSPAGRGGHLWLLFQEPIDPGAGHAAAHQMAPALESLAERWPRPDMQAIRLPGGYYHSEARGVCAAGWCRVALITPEGPPAWLHGPTAMAGLLDDAVTPASWVRATLPTDYLPANPPARAAATPPPAPPSPVISAPTGRLLPTAAGDPRWLAAVGVARHTMYFWVRPQEVTAWFNVRHPPRELLPPDPNGYGRAIWRGERTASVGYRPDGGWVDHGQGGRRADGSRDGGDPLDLYCRLHSLTRAQALRQVTREMISEASIELAAAASARRHPAAWVAAVLSPAGWYYYDHLIGAETAPDGPETARSRRTVSSRPLTRP